MLDCHRSLRNTAASYGPERPEAVRHFLRALIERSLSARGAVLTHGLRKAESPCRTLTPLDIWIVSAHWETWQKPVEGSSVLGACDFATSPFFRTETPFAV